MKPLLKYKAAIFDLDGTLIDSMYAWDNICRDWLLGKGKNPTPDLDAEIALMTLTESAEYVREHFGIDMPAEAIIDEWQDMVLELYKREIQLKPGAAELLRSLAGSGVKLGLATSCFPAAAQAVLARYGLWQLFSAVIYTDEVSRNKSFPDIWLAGAQRLAVEPADCVVFEDIRQAGSGIRATGMGFVAVHDARCAEWELLKQEADIAVESLVELL